MTSLRPEVVMSLRSSSVAITPLESATNFTDLRHGDGLLVSDNGKCFECLQRKANRRLQAFGECTYEIVLLGLGGHAISAGDLAELNAMRIGRVFGAEFLYRDHYCLAQFGVVGDARGFLDERNDLVQGDRRFSSVDDGFDV